ncbi:WD40 containing snare-dependent exocytosis protein [Crucibulum laeve]|uniref:WD40 containing snare-dependent exocytosis protein n=1 Tax=Crucibulum laeve TaxID=68775 RepID=A0A5C3MB38_9AGAR|nr:WD40 containing snare-dependent exocytosis protein [Crucibulum laeve]
MFSKQQNLLVYPDQSSDLRDEQDWRPGTLRTFNFPLNVTAFAIEPISGLLATGTASGLVYIHGGPGVESTLTLPEPLGVKFLHFAPLSYHLVCLDDNNQLHVWDLSTRGHPKCVATSRFDPTNSLTVSPSYSHVLLGMNTGEIKTYDLTCLRKSPYTLPNLWKYYQEKIADSGIPNDSFNSQTIVDILMHPRDLNLVFVAYTEQRTNHGYEFLIPPGAPGGAGYGIGDVLSFRRPEVTALTIHPSGHFFAVGYSDGSFAFWAVDDDERPILARTLDTIDVDLVDTTALEVHLAQEKMIRPSQPVREPVFKISWSGYSSIRNDKVTTLTILGGSDGSQGAGFTVMEFPKFNAPDIPAVDETREAPSIHPLIRAAARNSFTPTQTRFCATPGVVQDYLLIPSTSPHFSGNDDPYAILILSEAVERTRAITAYQYPPGNEIHHKAIQSADTDVERPQQTVVMDAQQKLYLPFSLGISSSILLNGTLSTVRKESYDEYVCKQKKEAHTLQLKGGLAWNDAAKANEIRLAKYQPHRVLITYHQDLTVQAYDFSAQLLASLNTEPITHNFPAPLPHFAMDVRPVLKDSTLRGMPMANVIIHTVCFAWQSMECAVVLDTGEVIVFYLSTSRNGRSSSRRPCPEICTLENLMIEEQNLFAPYFIFGCDKDCPAVCAISDIGFLALSYPDGSLFVIDMRVPNIILRPGQVSKTHRKKTSVSLSSKGHTNSPDPITSLSWTISSLGKDSRLRVRLITIRESGCGEIYTLSQSGQSTSWMVNAQPTVIKAITQPLPQGIFVLDGKTGSVLRADPARLAASLRGESFPGHCILVAVGTKGCRSFADISGERIGKVEWGHKSGVVTFAQIVERMGHHALVVLTENHTALIYSLPHLECLHTLPLGIPPHSLPFTIDESGDFLAWTQQPTSSIINSASYGSLFDIRRVYTVADVDFTTTAPLIPEQPQPISLTSSSLLGSWFNFTHGLSGNDIDNLLGGPNRPLPSKAAQANQSREGASNVASNVAASAEAAHENLYNRLTSALGERGQLLGELEERFNSLEEGSRNMVTQAKKLAAQQTAKTWFGKFG